MASPLNTQVREDLVKTFMLGERGGEECDKFNDFYEQEIIPRINSKFLAHMVAVVEEMIDKKIRKEIEAAKKENPSKQETGTPTFKRYNIIVTGNVTPENGTANTRCFAQGAVIIYKRNEDKNDIEKEKELRIFVAHELGHLLLKHGIINGTSHTENHANLLAYFAISGKNDFYVNKAPKFKYNGGESEIIGKIKEACPIDRENQMPPR